MTPAAASAAAVMLLAGCGVGGLGGGDDRPSAKPTANIDCAKEGKVPGSGSTAQQNAMEYWIRMYEWACSPVRVAYNPVGSGAGVNQFLRGDTAFGGSDTPAKSDDVTTLNGVCSGGRVINLPLVGGPIAIGHNVPGVEDLVLDAPTIAKIFDSRITRWNDPAIQELNPGTDLPPLPITAVHRSDDSGTTQNFQKYLAGAAPEVWSHPAEKAWQGRGGASANGSANVAADVGTTTGAIGYFELSFADELNIKTVAIDTGAAQPVPASTTSASAGIAAADVVGKGKDLTLKFDYRTSDDGAYPIVLLTYELVCDKGNLPETLPALKSFLTYAVSDEGQKPLPKIHYAPLPESVAAEVRQVVRTLS